MQEKLSTQYNEAVQQIKAAILRSQAKALAGVNQEQLALYYGIGRYISQNTRKGVWGKDAIATISRQLSAELPGLRGFSATNLRLMRIFYEEWSSLEANSSVATDEFQQPDTEGNEIHQLQLTNYEDFPIVAFMSIGFSHHSTILAKVKTPEERKFYIQLCHDQQLSVEGIQRRIAENAYAHRGQMANNFSKTIADYKQAFRAIQMFKDEYPSDGRCHLQDQSGTVARAPARRGRDEAPDAKERKLSKAIATINEIIKNKVQSYEFIQRQSAPDHRGNRLLRECGAEPVLEDGYW